MIFYVHAIAYSVIKGKQAPETNVSMVSCVEFNLLSDG